MFCFKSLEMKAYRLANMTRREEKVAASSFRALSSFRSFIMVSDTILFSVSYFVFKLDKANSAVCNNKNIIYYQNGVLKAHYDLLLV